MNGQDAIVPGSAVHLAQVETPIGRLDLVSAMAGSMNCLGTIERTGASATCGPGSIEESFEDVGGWASDGTWNNTQLYGPEGTSQMRITVMDGTEYLVHTHLRWGAFAWAATHGAPESVIYFDEQGEVIEAE